MKEKREGEEGQDGEGEEGEGKGREGESVRERKDHLPSFIAQDMTLEMFVQLDIHGFWTRV